jgi:phosphopantetheine adenylyltransferase
MARIDSLNHFLTDVAVAIKTKKEISAGTTITPADFDTLITSIDTIKGETRTVDPDTTLHTYTPSAGKNAITSITVNPVTSEIDQNIIAGNIKSGTSILGVTGSYDGGVAAALAGSY